MYKNRRILLIIISLFFAVNSSAQYKEDVYDKINRNMEIFGDVYKEILLNNYPALKITEDSVVLDDYQAVILELEN